MAKLETILNASTITQQGQVCINWGMLEAAGVPMSEIRSAIGDAVNAGELRRDFGGMWAGETLWVTA